MLVNNPVADLAKDEQTQTDVIQRHELVAIGGGTGGVDVQRAHQTRHEPVEGRVTEDVEGGHGVGAEAVDEDGLVLALEEVQLEESKQ